MSRADWHSAALVLLLHLLLAWALHTLMRRPTAPAAAEPTLQWITLPPLTAVPAAPAPAPRAATAPRAVIRPSAAAPQPPALAPREAALRLVEAPTAPEPVAPPASAASAPPTRLLDSAASRQALRQMGAQPLLSERAARAMDTEVTRTDAALANGVKAAQHGDCLKGEFSGAGWGLLSLPALAVAAARGQCAR
ncbi:hypothetical protein KAK06_08280 [Ideonella sp. 4Y11]|uniref:Uncharacterized protein n=1 Tax=Ideonella aquatica TaxID=2824119 RepID=A0A940YF12_9BURK|nr:hypothetical protein [Ideonella aquatica]MBQ0958955.1 hypothetical protein [Ideonella aquatica]